MMLKTVIIPTILILCSLFMLLMTLAEREHPNKVLYGCIASFLFVLLLGSTRL